jgi:predicted O-methyltransferase YrrM
VLQEAKIFDPSDRYLIDRNIIDDIALPVGDVYGDDVFSEYLADFAGIAKVYKPKRIFEVGTRYGYIGICMLLGAHNNPGSPKPEYLGIDDESYHFGSCDRANQNFAKVVPWASAKCIKFNSFYGLPEGIGTFDVCHVDGNHDQHGVLNDATRCWPLLNRGGLMLFDDATEGGPVYQGIMEFLVRFENSPEVVEFQYYPQNLRQHFYLRKQSE